jgi:hypothetical protein
MAAAVALVGGSVACQAGPCTTQIAQLQQMIVQAQAAAPPGGVGTPTAPQSVEAQLHHQPTPGAVEHAERRANAEGDAAIDRARKADAEGNAAACERALEDARELYGLQ